jgi:hypothetical protein
VHLLEEALVDGVSLEILRSVGISHTGSGIELEVRSFRSAAHLELASNTSSEGSDRLIGGSHEDGREFKFSSSVNVSILDRGVDLAHCSSRASGGGSLSTFHLATRVHEASGSGDFGIILNPLASRLGCVALNLFAGRGLSGSLRDLPFTVLLLDLIIGA